MATVIIGGGQAGLQVADSLRTGGYQEPITVIADDAARPYQRPPLSKEFLQSTQEAEALPLRTEEFFADQDITLLHGIAATRIDRQRQRVHLTDGQQLPYTHLVLTTGARNRQLTVPGSDLPGVHGLRTLEDAQRLNAAVHDGADVVVIGAGFIGLECASALLERGCRVTVLEFAPRPMGRALSPAMGTWFAQSHRDRGMLLQLDEGIERFEQADANGKITAVSTAGRTYPADVVIVGVGVQPNDHLAAEAGLETQNGIVVDANLRTSDPRIFAAGDCAQFPSKHAGGPARLESVQNATAQARHVAATILGSAEDYTALPWFWSVQGPYRLQIAGLVMPDDEHTIIGDPSAGKFSVLAFRDGKLAAVESVNSPGEHMAARHLLETSAPLSRREAEQAGFSLRKARKAAVQVTS